MVGEETHLYAFDAGVQYEPATLSEHLVGWLTLERRDKRSVNPNKSLAKPSDS